MSKISWCVCVCVKCCDSPCCLSKLWPACLDMHTYDSRSLAEVTSSSLRRRAERLNHRYKVSRKNFTFSFFVLRCCELPPLALLCSCCDCDLRTAESRRMKPSPVRVLISGRRRCAWTVANSLIIGPGISISETLDCEYVCYIDGLGACTYPGLSFCLNRLNNRCLTVGLVGCSPRGKGL